MKSTITREQITSWMNDANYTLEEPLNADDAAAARAILSMGDELLAAMDQKPALHRYRRKAVEPYGPYPWHYEEFVDYPRPVEGIEDEYFYAAPPVVTGVAVDSEPVAWTWRYREQWHVTNDERRAEFVAKDGDVAVLPLYRHAQPAPEKYNIGDATMRHIFTPTGMTNVSDMQAVFDRVEAVLVGMNQPAPVVPDGYVMVPMRLTAENGAKGALSGEFSETKFVNCPECFGADVCETCDGSGRIEITVPVTWTTIKEIWAKGVEHFSATPREVKSE